MSRISADEYSRIRSGVNDGKIPIGSPQHLEIIMFEMRAKDLPTRDKHIIKLAVLGWTQIAIADVVGLSRSTVGYVIRNFFGG